MARDANGTYTRVANSFTSPVNGTTISATDGEAFWDELETEMTDSLSRSGKGGMSDDLTITTTDTGAVGPAINLYQNSVSPLLSDEVGIVSFKGKNDANAQKTYAEITGTIFTTTAGVENGYLANKFMYSGTLRQDGVLFGYHSGTALEHIFHWYDNVNPFLYLESTNPAALGVQMAFFHDSPSPAVSDVIGYIFFDGRDSGVAPGNYQSYANIHVSISSPTATSEEALLTFSTVVAGTTADRAYFSKGLVVGSPTGGDKGVGTINATAVYDDGTILITCYPWEAAKSGKFDLEYWDNLVPNLEVKAEPRRVIPADKERGRPEEIIEEVKAETIVNRHGPARKFASRLGTPHDPTTIAGQRRHIEEKSHMTMYPNPKKFNEATRPSIGSLLQSGIEADELLFVYITQLEDRLEALEGKTKKVAKAKRK